MTDIVVVLAPGETPESATEAIISASVYVDMEDLLERLDQNFVDVYDFAYALQDYADTGELAELAAWLMNRYKGDRMPGFDFIDMAGEFSQDLETSIKLAAWDLIAQFDEEDFCDAIVCMLSEKEIDETGCFTFL